MMALDTLIAAGVVVGAGFYLYRKFARAGKTGGCGCAAGGGYCGAHDRDAASHCCSTKH